MLTLPETYANQRLALNSDTGYLDKRQTRTSDKTLIQLLNTKPKLKEHLQDGLDLDQIAMVQSVKDEELKGRARKLANNRNNQSLINEMGGGHGRPQPPLEALSPGQVRQFRPARGQLGDVLAQRFYSRQARPPTFRHGAYERKIPNASLGTTYWEYMCVLIAIIKSEGYGAVNTKTGQRVSDLDQAVQALHNHYIEAKCAIRR